MCLCDGLELLTTSPAADVEQLLHRGRVLTTVVTAENEPFARAFATGERQGATKDDSDQESDDTDFHVVIVLVCHRNKGERKRKNLVRGCVFAVLRFDLPHGSGDVGVLALVGANHADFRKGFANNVAGRSDGSDLLRSR